MSFFITFNNGCTTPYSSRYKPMRIAYSKILGPSTPNQFILSFSIFTGLSPFKFLTKLYIIQYENNHERLDWTGFYLRAYLFLE